MPLRPLRLLLLCLPLGPAALATEADPDPLFSDFEVLDVRIRAPIRSIMTERPDEEYVEGTFTYTEPDGREVTFDIGLRTRGQFRRRADICEFAPLRLNFRKSQIQDTLFDGQDKLKLVTHCENRSPNYEQAVVAEYVAYRIFNLLTELSFRARLLEITYVDTDRDERVSENYAILIEHKDRFAERNGLQSMEVQHVTEPQLEPSYAALGALFQYFLGNTDFSQFATAPGEDCCHNHDLFGTRDGNYYPVPYDFDMTGFVEAPHAQPNPRFRLRNVRQRLYRGRCVYNVHLDAAIERFISNRDAIYELIRSQEQLRPGKTRDQIRFVDGFFDDIESPRAIRKNLLDECI